jgi:hypothetical protein
MAVARESHAKDQGNSDEIKTPGQKAFSQVDTHYLQQRCTEALF